MKQPKLISLFSILLLSGFMVQAQSQSAIADDGSIDAIRSSISFALETDTTEEAETEVALELEPAVITRPIRTIDDAIAAAVDTQLRADLIHLSRLPKVGEVVGPNDERVTSGFGPRFHPVHGVQSFHGGIDSAIPGDSTGIPIYAVAEPGDQIEVTCWYDVRGGGLVVMNTASSYPGMRFETLHADTCVIPTGTSRLFQVKDQPLIIGRVGNSGTGTGPHRHFQERNLATNEKVPPKFLYAYASASGISPRTQINQVLARAEQREQKIEPAVEPNLVASAVPVSTVYKPQEPVEVDLGLEFELATDLTAASSETQPEPESANQPERENPIDTDTPETNSSIEERSLTATMTEIEPKDLFDSDGDGVNDQHSLVAVAVGSAEGTRNPDGSFTEHYAQHIDPGNGVLNLGSFSYQHGASSPEEADQKQLDRLEGQFKTIQARATEEGLAPLTLEEKLNGIDLANQSPRAALQAPGDYIQRLREAEEKGLAGSDAILAARTNAYRNPNTGNLSAPGLLNAAGVSYTPAEDQYYEIVERDQKRRQDKIQEAIDQFEINKP